MDAQHPEIAEAVALGEARLAQLREVAAAPSDEFFPRLLALPWVRVKEVVEHPLNYRGGLYGSAHEAMDILCGIVGLRGPGILGYLNRLELSFSARAQASYTPQSRVVRVDLGLAMLVNELEETYRWLDSLLFAGAEEISLDALQHPVVPAAARDELLALFDMATRGGIPLRRKRGMEHPIALAMLRFVLAHEIAHLTDSAESPRIRSLWRETAWTDYQDALDYLLDSGSIDRDRHLAFLRTSLPETTAQAWEAEFVADGLAFHTLLRLPQPSTGGRHPYAVLQVAVELFFHALLVAYRSDLGTDTHPPPIARSATIRSRRRKDHGVDWPTFLSGYWGAGAVTSEVVLAGLRQLRGSQ